jgi:hypothetical protein
MNRFSLLAALVALALPVAGSAVDAGVFQIPGTQSTIKFNGFVQLDATYDIEGRVKDIENNDYATITSIQPLEGSAAALERGQTYLTGRTSRFGLQTVTPSDLGNVNTRLEVDLNGPNDFQGQTFTNSMLFRLRHAYGQVGGLLVGQTWSTFLDLNAFPDTVDFNGPGSVAAIRQPQIRYTLPLGSLASLSVSAENSRNGGVGHLPDFVAKLSAEGKYGTVALAGVTNQYRFNKAGDVTPRSDTLQGYGVALSGSFKVLKDAVVAQVIGGDGIGRYLFNAGTAGQSTGLDSAGDPALWRAYAYHLGYTRNWSEKFRSNVVWSQTFLRKNGIVTTDGVVDDDATGSIAPNKRIDQAFVNTFWSFTKNAAFGLEYEWGRRHTFDDRKGRQDRVTGTFHYDFF